MENKRTPKMILAFVVICFALGAIVTYAQLNNQPLPGYVEGNNNIFTTVAPYTVETTMPDMTHYDDEATGISLNVPADWKKIIKDGFTTFIHAQSSTYIQLQSLPYQAGVNNMTEESIRLEIANAGAAFVSFTKDSNCGYTVLYQTKDGETIYDYIEITRVDRQYIVRVVICATHANYQKLEKEIMLSAESITWTPRNPIPDNFLLAYNEFGNFEFAVPITWNRGIEEGEYVARDPETGTEMRVGVMQSNANYAGVNQALYAEYTGAGKSGFTVRQFSASQNIVYAVSSYIINGISVNRVEYMLATGAFEYTIAFVCPVDYYQNMAPLFETAIQLFRTF